MAPSCRRNRKTFESKDFDLCCSVTQACEDIRSIPNLLFPGGLWGATRKAFLAHPCLSLSALITVSQNQSVKIIPFPCTARSFYVSVFPDHTLSQEPGPQVQAVCSFHML